jgi:5'-3' exonuclease
MGVPGFFAWISAKFKKKIILTHINKRPKYLYIDANCLFHPECFRVLEGSHDVTNLEKLEKLMFNRIVNYLNYLEGVVNPSVMMFIAVDGVAPLAKIGQQRKRRFKSVIDNKLKNEIKVKHNVKFNNMWSNTVISPGTIFMEKLHRKLQSHYSQRNQTRGIKYVYSSYHTPGEGEHKLLQHIKSNTSINDDIVIYGLDADLLFLALASKRNNIYLLREESHITGQSKKEDLYDIVEDVAQDLLFVSISGLKESYNEEIRRLLKKSYEHKGLLEKAEEFEYLDEDDNLKTTGVNTCDYSVDLIFMCFLLGNDFLPHFPSIDIHKGGLDQIITAYIDCSTDVQSLLINRSEDDDIIINNVFLLRMIFLLSDNEEKFFRETLPKALERSHAKRCYVSGDYAREIWNLENMKTFEVEDQVGLGFGEPAEWKYRYYEHYFFVAEHQELMIESLVKIYLEGVMWVAKYYFDKCPDWQWQYPYNNAPFISDVARYGNLINNINNITFPKRTNIPIMSQLLSVLPPQCNEIIPPTYASLMTNSDSPIIDVFPTHVKLDMLYKDLYWKCEPKLPWLDIDRVLEQTEKLKLTPEEQIRNKELKEFQFG